MSRIDEYNEVINYIKFFKHGLDSQKLLVLAKSKMDKHNILISDLAAINKMSKNLGFPYVPTKLAEVCNKLYDVLYELGQSCQN